ncbi:MAG TPA: protein kinase [Polyangiaceae bacterium]
MAPVPVAVGEVIAGKYRVERVIGSGGMGMVVAAWHVQLDQLVAVKLLHSETAGTGDATERFRREARAAARIRCEHVARVIDVGIWTGGIPYIVMEYLDGNDVAAELAARGPLPVEEAVDYVMQAIEALAEAHAVGIVHRDLKPGNLFLAQRADGSRLIKVLDFGISKHASAAGEAALTRTSSLIGSPLYMSPEQMRSARTVDARADIWSLGAILFELLTGQTPFGGETVIEACTAILNDELPSLVALRPDVPPQLESIIRRCLEKDRANRYPSVGDLATELATISPASRVHAERALRVLGTGGSRHSAPGPMSGGFATPGGSNPMITPSGFTPSGSNPMITPSGLTPGNFTPSGFTPGGSNPIGRPSATPVNGALGMGSGSTPSPVAGAPHTSASWETGTSSKARRWPLVVVIAAVVAVIAAVGYREFAPRSASGPAETSVAVPAAPPPVVATEPVPPAPEPLAAPSTSGSGPVVSVLPSTSATTGRSRPVARPTKPAAVTPMPSKAGGDKPSRPNGDGISDFGGRR